MSGFGAKFSKVWPSPEGFCLKLTEFGKRLLAASAQMKELNEIDLNEIIRTSSQFPIEFGTQTCRIENQPRNRHPFIQQQVASAYPLIHERVLWLYLSFLEHKCKHGNKIERSIYNKLSLADFVQRLLNKRYVVFMGSSDQYVLISNKQGYGGFETIGTHEEKPPLVLNDVLSYDEIKLSALLSVSSHSEFLNNGNRFNAGVIEKNKSKIEQSGVVIGMIGARFEKPDVMEWQDILITKSQNTKPNGYGNNDTDNEKRSNSYRKLWKSFYEEPDFLYDQVVRDEMRFRSLSNDIFDSLIMKKRYAISFDMLLLESEARAKLAGKRAYIHVVGFGLGVWRIIPEQRDIFLMTFAERLRVLMPRLFHVAFVNFSWFHMKEFGDLKHGNIMASETHPDGGVRIYFSDRNPADKMPRPEHENTLLIVSYAWDGNALPGNEFWLKSLSGSGDPAAACSTLITEIHNPHINTKMVCGENLHIASVEHRIMHISEYIKQNKLTLKS